jgi:hypothetical protein
VTVAQLPWAAKELLPGRHLLQERWPEDLGRMGYGKATRGARLGFEKVTPSLRVLDVLQVEASGNERAMLWEDPEARPYLPSLVAFRFRVLALVAGAPVECPSQVVDIAPAHQALHRQVLYASLQRQDPQQRHPGRPRREQAGSP